MYMSNQVVYRNLPMLSEAGESPQSHLTLRLPSPKTSCWTLPKKKGTFESMIFGTFLSVGYVIKTTGWLGYMRDYTT